MNEGSRRGLFAGLAVLAALALVGAVVAWLLAVKDAGTWIIACLIVLVLVIAAEVVLLVMARRKTESYREPEPHKGPGADDEVLDFVIDEENSTSTEGTAPASGENTGAAR